MVNKKKDGNCNEIFLPFVEQLDITIKFGMDIFSNMEKLLIVQISRNVEIPPPPRSFDFSSLLIEL